MPYGLQKPPHHWYNMIPKVLHVMGLSQSKHYPCLLLLHTPNTSSPPNSCKPIYVSLYTDNLFFFSDSQEEEDCLKRLLAEKFHVDFMGKEYFFLGQTFQ